MQGIERSWPDKIVYEIQIPGRAYVIGDPIQLDFRYIALRKGVYPSSIQVRLVEWHILQLIGGLGQFRHAQAKSLERRRWEAEDSILEDRIRRLFPLLEGESGLDTLAPNSSLFV